MVVGTGCLVSGLVMACMNPASAAPASASSGSTSISASSQLAARAIPSRQHPTSTTSTTSTTVKPDSPIGGLRQVISVTVRRGQHHGNPTPVSPVPVGSPIGTATPAELAGAGSPPLDPSATQESAGADPSSAGADPSSAGASAGADPAAIDPSAGGLAATGLSHFMWILDLTALGLLDLGYLAVSSTWRRRQRST
jgi:hypothetical protein